MSDETKDVVTGRAISIRQPYVEDILRGNKKYEYRSRPTKIRGRVFLYASMGPGDEEYWAQMKMEPGDLPTGVIVGSVDIVACEYFEEHDSYGYKLENPRRYEHHLKPTNQPQPLFFFPFKTVDSSEDTSQDDMAETSSETEAGLKGAEVMDERKQFLIDSIEDHLALGRPLTDIARRLRAIASDEEIEAALSEFKAQSSAIKAAQTVNTLIDDQEYESWYKGPSDDPQSHWQLLTEVLRHKRTRPWSDDMIRSLDYSSSTVVAHLAPPKSQVPRAVKGLVLGYVQSGKTANFSAVISKAVDSGYKLVVVLAGMHNILRLQTQARLHEEIVLPKESACTTLTKVDEKGDFQKNQFVKANRALGGNDGFTLVVLKKNSSVLRNFNSWLSEASEDTLRRCPTLVIDDESDQASVNTNRPEDDPTAINEHIRNIIKRFPIISYVGYTATPFANVLIDASVDDDLFPKDFLVSLEKPMGYVGTEELFGREAIEPHGALAGLPVIRTIPDDEAARLSGKKKSKGTSSAEDPILPSMIDAFDAFIIGCSVRLARNQWKQHMTMLMHTSHLVAQHMALKSAFDDYILNLKLDRKEEDPELMARLQEVWERDFLPVSSSKTFNAAVVPPFSTIWKNTEKFIERLEVIMENHESEERLTYDRPDPFWGIVIGGNTLSRGLTLEGLTTSYFVRGSKGYDTLLQMGRWFGYRPDYVDLTRIYVSDDLQSKFYHLATVEQEVRDEIKTMAANRERPRDVGLRIRTHPSMTVTSNLKMRNAQSCTLTYSAAKIQALYMNLNDSSLLKSNFQAVVQLLDGIEKYHGQYSAPGFDDLSSCLLYRNISPELILQFMERYKFSSANIRFTAKMIVEYIHDLTKVGELTKWSVALMSPKTGKSLDLGNGRKIFKVDRSVMKKTKSERDPSADHIKVITAPRDELIDLKDQLLSRDARTTEEIFKNDPELTEVYFRQNLRPRDRGLLMLYALNPNLEMTQEEVKASLESPAQTMPLRASGDAFAVSFVFPKTHNSKSTYRYLVNGTV